MQPLRLPESAPAGLTVWQLALDLAAPPCEADWALLSEDERQRALRLQRHEDRVRAVAPRAALRRLLAARLRQPAHLLRFATGPHGKPRLDAAAHAAPCIEFNLSHAGRFALIALSDGGPVGIDIERHDDALDVAALATQLESPVERAAVGGTGIGFFERWTVKEAALKALGLGIAEHLQHLSVLGRAAGAADGSAGYQLHADCAGWPPLRAWPLDAPAGYVAVLAWAAPQAATAMPSR